MTELIIAPEFRDKIPTLSEDEFSRLEENILSDGEIRDPIVVWNNIIIDGHNRWAIIQKHPELSDKYKVKSMDFPDKWAAIVWMCRNQLGRRNLKDEQRAYLIGKQYEAERMTVGAPIRNQNAKKQIDQNGQIDSVSTRKRIAIENGTSEGRVQRSSEFATGLDAAEQAAPGIKDAVLSGEVKVPKRVIAEIRRLPEEKRKKAAEAIREGKPEVAKEIVCPNPEPAQELAHELDDDDRSAFTVEDFQELIDAAVNTLDYSLELHFIMTHSEMLNIEAAREAAWKSLDGGIAVIDRYKKLILEARENGGKN